MTMKKFSISEDVLAAVIAYIQERPLKEVMQLMTLLQNDLKFIGEEEVERSEVKTPTNVEEETDKKEEKSKKKTKKK